MKTTNKFLALAIMAVAMVFASCSKDDNDPVGPTQQEIETKIVGKWKSVTMNGEQMLTNDRNVRKFNADGTQTLSISHSFLDIGYCWKNQEPFNYTIDKNVLAMVGSHESHFYTVEQIDDKNLYLIGIKVIIDDKEKSMNMPLTMNRVTADYSQDIIGLWEGVSMTGYETYGDYHHRIEYRADGTYTYYSWDETTQTWQPLEDVFDEWNVDGDWLATRWQNKGSDVMNYEWWDIDYIKKEGNDIIMKWSALREKEDGTRFNTTFTWKKVK